MEIEEIMTSVKAGRRNILQPELEGVCGEIAALSAQCAKCVRFALLSSEEAYNRQDIQPWLEGWATIAQNAALSAPTLILEARPELPKAQGQEYAQGKGDSLEVLDTHRQESQKNNTIAT
jgi:hypothetical protein